MDLNEIFKFLDDNDNRPNISRVVKLIEMANEFHEKNTLEGMLSSVFIYNQVIEELLIVLHNKSTVFMNLSIYPSHLTIPLKKNKPLGYYISELERVFEFEEKARFIEEVKQFNTIRNKLAHDLPAIGDEELRKHLSISYSKFNSIIELYDDIDDWFNLCFKDFKKDVFFEYREEEFDE